MTLSNDSLAVVTIVVFFLGAMMGGLVYEEYGKKGMTYLMVGYGLAVASLVGWGILRVLQHT